MIHETDFDSTTTGAGTPGRRMSSDVPQPCWVALDAARELAFTGEIVFDAEPEARVYLDNGVAYYAERATDATLGRRLIDSGLVDAVQLESGIVRVGDVEHLGRLFDRVPSVDRDAVMVITEDATEALLADLANNVIAPSRATAYRHHESGVHRWFVAPASTAHLTRPVSEVAPVDNSVVEDLPGLPSGDADVFGDDLRIEWDQPLIAVDEPRQTEPELDFDDDLLAVDDARSIIDSPFTDRVVAADREASADEVDAEPPVEPAAGPAPFAPPPAAEVVGPEGGFEPSVVADEVDQAVSPSADELIEPVVAEPELADDRPAESVSTEPESTEPESTELESTEPELTDAELTEPELTEPESTDLESADAELTEPESTDLESADAELAEPEMEEASPVGFESLVIDLDALIAPVDDVFDVEPRHEPEIEYELEVPHAPVEVAGPVDDEFFIFWPDGTEERPVGGDGSPGETPALIAGEALLSQPETEIAPDVAPASEIAEAPNTAPAPGADAEPETAPVSDAELMVELAAAPESAPPSELDDASDAVSATGVAPADAPDEVPSSDIAPAPATEQPAAAFPAVETTPATPSPTLAAEEPQPLGAPAESGSASSTVFDQAAPEADPTATPHVDFEVPALILSDLPSADGAVPDEVSSAVLRAIRAIENASTAAPSVAPILGTESAPPAPPAEADPAPIGFAPPTLATSAEVMYAAEREAAAAESDVGGDAATPTAVTPEPRVASVVFVDDDEEPEPEDRAGALRRLISSLRRR